MLAHRLLEAHGFWKHMCIQKGLCLSGALLWKGVKHSPETAAVSPGTLPRRGHSDRQRTLFCPPTDIKGTTRVGSSGAILG